MKPASSPRAILERVLPILVLAFFLLFFYTLFHELGHALAGLLQGGRLEGLSINFFNYSAHASIAGDFSAGQRTLISAAGMALPVFVWFVFLLLAPRRANWTVEALKFLSTANIFGSLIPWAVLPVLYLAGNPPPGDDVTHFLDFSGFPALAVAGCFVLALAGVILFYRARSEGMAGVRRVYLGEGLREPGGSARRTFFALTAGLAAAALLGYALGGFSEHGSGFGAGVPAGYALAGELDLAEASAAGGPVLLAEVPGGQADLTGLFLTLDRIEAQQLVIRLVQPDGDSFVLLQGEDYTARADRVQTSRSLGPGPHRVEVTAQGAVGQVRLYVQGAQEASPQP